MMLRKCALLAALFAIGAIAASAGFGYGATGDAPKPGAWLRAAMPAPAVPAGCGNRQGNAPGPRILLPGKSESPSPFFVPVQFKDPRALGVGKLLVASRRLGDPNFAETVVLLVHYDDKGVIGLILNRRTDLPLSKVLDLKAAKRRTNPAYLGGPVGTSHIFALFKSSNRMDKAERVFGGVYFIADRAVFEKTLSARPDRSVFHVYVGYAGWTPGQLQAEVRTGAWFIFPADAAAVFGSNPDSLWLKMIQRTEVRWTKTGPLPWDLWWAPVQRRIPES